MLFAGMISIGCRFTKKTCIICSNNIDPSSCGARIEDQVFMRTLRLEGNRHIQNLRNQFVFDPVVESDLLTIEVE